MIIDMSNGFHFRPEALGFLLAWNDPEETPGYKTDFEPAFIEKVLTRAADRVPIFENLAVNPKRAWAGSVRDDARPPSDPGRGSGRSRVLSGQWIQRPWRDARSRDRQDLVGFDSDGKDRTLVDVSLLGLSRFAEGRMIEETAVL